VWGGGGGVTLNLLSKTGEELVGEEMSFHRLGLK